MILHPSLVLISIVLFVLPVSAQQPAGQCKAKLTYENRNQIENRPISITGVSGIAQDTDQVPIPGVCLGLFTEVEHQLVDAAVTDQKGRFDFGRVNPGRYRLVAEYEGFCTANLAVLVRNRSSKHKTSRKRLVFHMRLAGIDSCSYGEYR